MFSEGNGFSLNNYNATVCARLKLTGENRARGKRGGGRGQEEGTVAT